MNAPQGSGIADFIPGCSAHDICYETCNSDKATCDEEFRKTIVQECLQKYPFPASGRREDDLDWAHRGGCLSRARLYARLVKDAGQNAYDNAQRISCECCPARVQVRARYSRIDQLLTAFVRGAITDEGFQFEMDFPPVDQEPTVINVPGGGATSLVDTRAGCITPTISGVWDQFSATKVAIIGSFLSVEGTKSVPAITLGVGEGDCATMTRTESPVSVATGLQVALPLEFFTSETPPSVPVTVTEDGWTFTFTTKP